MGDWLNAQRRNHTIKKLSPERTRRLLELGVDLDPLEAQWEEAYAVLKRHFKADGKVTQRWVSPEGLRVGAWISTQIGAARTGQLRPDRATRLHELGIQGIPAEVLTRQQAQAKEEVRKVSKMLEDLRAVRELARPEIRATYDSACAGLETLVVALGVETSRR